MTRINVGYPVEQLTTKHLIAEHRESKRIPNQVKSGKVKVKHIPTFRLGTGHVHFFTNRLGYLKKRYIEVYNECIKRGYNVQNYINAWDGIPEELMGDYIPTESDKALIQERINSKLSNNMKKILGGGET